MSEPSDPISEPFEVGQAPMLAIVESILTLLEESHHPPTELERVQMEVLQHQYAYQSLTETGLDHDEIVQLFGLPHHFHMAAVDAGLEIVLHVGTMEDHRREQSLWN